MGDEQDHRDAHVAKGANMRATIVPSGTSVVKVEPPPTKNDRMGWPRAR